MTNQQETFQLGASVEFWNDDERLQGILNGEPRGFGEDESVVTHLPIYVHEGDKHFMVALPNVIAIAGVAR